MGTPPALSQRWNEKLILHPQTKPVTFSTGLWSEAYCPLPTFTAAFTKPTLNLQNGVKFLFSTKRTALCCVLVLSGACAMLPLWLRLDPLFGLYFFTAACCQFGKNSMSLAALQGKTTITGHEYQERKANILNWFLKMVLNALSDVFDDR